ncbi:MAG: TrmJ/YjtD family RNA methyltransferase [Candidatus Solibacter usitatus]|nr:TrmJ/YjtD family RNA methyltransferase [Candidatus Solibacter usitatus]
MHRNQRLAVVLIDTRNPLNIGAAARAMSNFGFFDLRLVHPYDVAFREAVSAVGASALMKNARVYGNVAEAVADCSLVVGATGLGHRQLQHPLHRLEKAGRLLRRHTESAHAALLFGSEKFGLSNSDVSHCHWLLHIPTRPEHESMNLAQAVAVCLYELIRQPSAARRIPEPAGLAPAEEVERLTLVLQEVLQESGYTDYTAAKSGQEKTHRLVRRLALRAKDAPVLTGMLRQIMWKLKNP